MPKFTPSSKAFLHVPEENWKIFENTHPAIIDRETFAIVKELCQHKRRHQQIDVYYHGVGIVYIPTAEEIGEMFEEHLEDVKWEREQEVNIKEKTA